MAFLIGEAYIADGMTGFLKTDRIGVGRGLLILTQKALMQEPLRIFRRAGRKPGQEGIDLRVAQQFK